MKPNTSSMTLLSILIVIGGMVLNFSEFLMGSPATPKNLIVTLIYAAAWLFILITTAKTHNRRVMTYYTAFWSLTLFTALITAYAGHTSAQVDWAIPFALLVMGQWYGVTYFVGSFTTSAIIVATLSLGAIFVSLAAIRDRKYHC